MSYYSEPDSHIIDKVKVVLDLSNYAAKKANYANKRKCYPGVDISDSAAKKGFIAVETEVDKLNIARLINVPSSLNNLTIEVDNLSLDEWKTVTINLKKLSHVVDNQVVKNTKFNISK